MRIFWVRMMVVGCGVLGGCGVQHSTRPVSEASHADGATSPSSLPVDTKSKDSGGADPYDTEHPSFLKAWNGGVYRFNRVLDKTILWPVHFIFSCFPTRVKRCVYNFLSNLERPISMVNAVLQLNHRAFFQHTCCLVLNTTVGVGGLFDVSGLGLNMRPKRIEFGDTLYNVFGIPSGPLVMMPAIGPLMVRDFVSRSIDFLCMPTTYLPIDRWIYFGVKFVEEKSRSIDIENAMEKSFSEPMMIIERMYQDRQALRHDNADAADPLADDLRALDDDEGDIDDDETPPANVVTNGSSTGAKKGVKNVSTTETTHAPDNGADPLSDDLRALDDDEGEDDTDPA